MVENSDMLSHCSRWNLDSGGYFDKRRMKGAGIMNHIEQELRGLAECMEEIIEKAPAMMEQMKRIADIAKGIRFVDEGEVERECGIYGGNCISSCRRWGVCRSSYLNGEGPSAPDDSITKKLEHALMNRYPVKIAYKGDPGDLDDSHTGLVKFLMRCEDPAGAYVEFEHEPVIRIRFPDIIGMEIIYGKPPPEPERWVVERNVDECFIKKVKPGGSIQSRITLAQCVFDITDEEAHTMAAAPQMRDALRMVRETVCVHRDKDGTPLQVTFVSSFTGEQWQVIEAALEKAGG